MKWVVGLLGFLVVGAVCVTAAMGTFNSGGPSAGPDLDVDQCPVDAGTNLTGSASSCNPPVTVTATHDGNHLSGSPDTTSFGGINSFSFPVPSSATGQIVVTATDALGGETVKYVDID